MKTEMFEDMLADKELQAAMMDFHRLLKAPLRPEEVDLEGLFIRTIEQLSQGDAEFAENYAALSEEQRQTLRKDAIRTVSDALKGNGLDFEAIRKAFLTSSYACEIKGRDFIVTRDGETLLHLTNLDTVEGIASATAIEIASIIVEAVCLVLSVVGFPRPGSRQVVKAAEAIVKRVAKSTALQRAVRDVAEAFKSGNRWKQAESIFKLIKAVNADGLIPTIIKILFEGMKWYEYAYLVTKALLYIAAVVLTDGFALIAKLILILADAVEFIAKLANLDKLNAMALATT